MDIDKTLDSLETDLAGLLSDTPSVELKEFATKADFIAYAKEQVSLAKADEDEEIRTARLTHLYENVKLAKNGFEDTDGSSLPIFSGPQSVQAQTAWAERSDKKINPAAAAASTQPGPKGFTQKSEDDEDIPLTQASLLSAFEDLLGNADGDEDGADGTAKGDGEAGDDDDDKQVAKGDDKDEGGDKKTPAKKADPWGTGLDMNWSESDDPDDYNSSVRSF